MNPREIRHIQPHIGCLQHRVLTVRALCLGKIVQAEAKCMSLPHTLPCETWSFKAHLRCCTFSIISAHQVLRTGAAGFTVFAAVIVGVASIHCEMANTRYLFNGDMVDRGSQACQDRGACRVNEARDFSDLHLKSTLILWINTRFNPRQSAEEAG